MQSLLRLVLGLFLMPLVPSLALAEGAWTTYIRAEVFRDALADRDTVWLATAEAGLVRYVATTGEFSSLTRDPSGLSSNDLSVVERDRSGNLWIGTFGAGVSRLSPDGSWRVLNAFDGLPSDSVNCMTVVGDTVWIGTTRGVAVWDGREISGRLPDGFSPSPFSNDFIVGIVQAGDSLWVFNTTDVYVSRISTGLLSWTLENANVPVGGGWISAASQGRTVWGMTRTGATAFRVSGPGTQWAPTGAPLGFAIRLESSNGTLFAITEAGVAERVGSSWVPFDPPFSCTRVFPATVPAPARESSGQIWVARSDGLYEKPPVGTNWAQHAPSSPPGNNLFNVAIHRGRVYVTAHDKGIGRFDGFQWRNWTAGGCGAPCDTDTTFISPLFSFTLMEDRSGFLWFAPWGTSITRLDDSGPVPSFDHYFGPIGDPNQNDLHTRAVGATTDSTGGRWFGMDTDDFGNPARVPLGLEHYNAGSHYVANYNAANNDTVLAGRIHALTTDRSGRVWAGSLEGGIQFFDRLDAPIFFDVPNTSNLSVRALEARGDTLYAMTTRDVRLYNRFTAAFIDSFLLPAAPVLSGHPLLVDSERTILVGTANGVRIRRPDGSISDLTTANSPLANDEVRAIREEPGTGAYWIATAGGLHRYDPNYVPPPPPPLPTLQFRIYPNPALLSAIGTSLRLSGNASSYEGEIYDLSGRLVNRFSAGASGQLMWNGRDTNGEVVPAGVYFLRVVAGSNTGFARIVLLH